MLLHGVYAALALQTTLGGIHGGASSSASVSDGGSISSKGNAVSEVTVEDPAPGFVKLRDATDLALCHALGAFSPSPGTADTADNAAGKGGGGGGGSGVSALSEEALWRVQELTKLTKPQVLLCHEAHCLARRVLKGMYVRS